MLNLMKEMNILKYLDGRKHQNAEMFQKVSDKLAEARFQEALNKYAADGKP